MVQIITLVVFSFGLLFSNIANADDDETRNEINKHVSQLVGLLTDSYADESENYRGIKVLKDPYGGRIVAAIFTLSGAGEVTAGPTTWPSLKVCLMTKDI
jgi:hypothetical protein